MCQSKKPLSAIAEQLSPESVSAAQSSLSQAESSSLHVSLQSSCAGDKLGFIQFARASDLLDSHELHCELPLLAPEHGGELWRCGAEPAQQGVNGDVLWYQQGDFRLVGMSRPCSTDSDVEALTEAMYAQLLQLIAASGAPYLVRCWNYLPQINAGMEQGDVDNEVYKHFCTGRLRAFESAGMACTEFPSASAVGHHGRQLSIHVLAHATPGRHLGNDQQVEAFEYPRQYGISSPSFARATHLVTAQRDTLFISGTASIIGHVSQCIGDLSGQLQVTLDNMEHLLRKADKQRSDITYVRVYLRHAEDLAVARDFARSSFAGANVVFLLADICRAELLVEIECVCL